MTVVVVSLYQPVSTKHGRVVREDTDGATER